MHFKYSAVIPTYKRASDLINCVEHLVKQTIPPDEIVVSAVSSDRETSQACKLLEQMHPSMKIRLVTTDKRGISAGRNLGLKEAVNDLVLMIDDDVEIPEDFAERGFQKLIDEDCLIVSGFQENLGKPRKVQNLIRKIFLLDYYEKNMQKVLPTGSKVMAYEVDNDLRVEFLGSHVWLMKRSIANDINFDETMILYSHREDQDFSYQVYKKYGPRLLLSPSLLFLHNHSSGGRLKNEFIVHIFINNLALNFRKHFFQEKNKILFLWSLIGWILQGMHQAFKLRKLELFIETARSVCFIISKWQWVRRFEFNKFYERISS